MYKDKYNFWLQSDYFDKKTKEELVRIKDDEKEIEDRFFKDLEFGTGGLRGKLGAGTNRMNIYTVRCATQGLANYILERNPENKKKGVVIAHDPRHMSDEFTKEAAAVLNANGIKTYVFDGLRPTPELSFSVRYLKAAAGIVITASHNPPAYNGYKVYLDDGGQAVSPYADYIIDKVEAIKDITKIVPMNIDEAKSKGLYNVLPSGIDDEYIKMVKSQVLNSDLIKSDGDKLSIIYTPLHGAGNIPTMRSLTELGFTDVRAVKEQQVPDPDFSTVRSPNPEEHDAFTLALKLTESRPADILIGTDPDSDRLGVFVNHGGEYTALTGHQQGVLLMYYILKTLKDRGALPKNAAVVKTIATTGLADVIAHSFGVHVDNTLIGFKYIGEKIKEYEKTGYQFIYGYEESYGYLKGTSVRDKDGIIAACLFCDMALYYKKQNMDLLDVLDRIYKQYGYYTEYLKNIYMEGIEGMDKMNAIMTEVRKKEIDNLAGYEIVSRDDYLTGKAQLKLPKSNVLRYNFKDGGFFLIRPSGTEPKIKIYISAVGSTKAESENKLSKIEKAVDGLLK